MDKLRLHTPDLVAQNVERIAELFPGCVTEAHDDLTGNVTRKIDFDQLRQELSDHIVEGPRERYHLDWPGKCEALLAANAPIAKTLRPCREESVDFDTTKNLFIDGDNLDALKLLQESYLGKVQMIYIDPPYNSGNDVIYKDDYAEDVASFLARSQQVEEFGGRLVANPETNGRFHSDWVSMIYPRLKLARNLLKEDGLIFISVDDVEVSTLRRTCDEVFGEKNFIAQLVWKKAYGGGAKSKHCVTLHEYVLMYAREKSSVPAIELPPDEAVLKYYKYRDDKYERRGPYRKQPLATNSMDERPNLRFPIRWRSVDIWPEKQWQWSKERVDEAQRNDDLVFTQKADGWTVDYKQYLRDEDGVERSSKLYSVLDGPYTQAGTADIESLFGSGKVFAFPKPTDLIAHLIRCTRSEGVILDFFAGSATTAHAVLALNEKEGRRLRFIVVQTAEPCAADSEAAKAGFRSVSDIGKERIRRVGARLTEASGSGVDVGFRVLRIDSTNMKDVHYTPDTVKQEDLLTYAKNVKEDRTPEDLLFQVLVDWGLDLALPIDQQTIDGRTVFFVDSNGLAACFEQDVSEDVVKEIAKRKPLRAVFRDSSFASDSAKINVEQIFKLQSPGTELKAL
jgi:adenine-specific DNA-methyltransferase